MRLPGALLCTLAIALIAPGVAGAEDIHVRPGDGLQKAIDRASPGDVLRLHGGHFNPGAGKITIDKRLTLVGYNARPRIRGNCARPYVVEVRADDVVLNHLKVVKAFYADVDYRFLAGGKAKDLKVEAKCEGVEYGVNVFDTGGLEVVNNIGTGYEDAGVYVGAIADTGGGTLAVTGNDMFGNNRGILIEDSNSTLQSIAVINNNAHNNTLPGEGATNTGIFLTNSIAVLVSGNLSNNNGTYGFELVNNSDSNVFNGNTANGNSGGAFFAEAESDGSCGENNVPLNFGLSACP
jgi:nitrous oxidase accessory protein NosD